MVQIREGSSPSTTTKPFYTPGPTGFGPGGGGVVKPKPKAAAPKARTKVAPAAIERRVSSSGSRPSAPRNTVPAQQVHQPSAAPAHTVGTAMPAPGVKLPGATAAPKLPSFEDYAMKDSSYQAALAAYNANLADAQTSHDKAFSEINLDRDNQLNDYQTQFDRSQQALTDDYASRGLGNSGLYAQARDQFVSDEEAQRQALMDAIQRRLEANDTQLTDAKTADAQNRAAARQAAAQRGAGKYTGVV